VYAISNGCFDAIMLQFELEENVLEKRILLMKDLK